MGIAHELESREFAKLFGTYDPTSPGLGRDRAVDRDRRRQRPGLAPPVHEPRLGCRKLAVDLAGAGRGEKPLIRRAAPAIVEAAGKADAADALTLVVPTKGGKVTYLHGRGPAREGAAVIILPELTHGPDPTSSGHTRLTTGPSSET